MKKPRLGGRAWIGVIGVTVVTLLGALMPASAQEPGDPHRGAQWALDVIGADDALATSNGDGVLIAVIDTGADLDHPDLVDKILYYPDADFVEPKGTCKKKTCVQDGAQDRNGHGTMVAGIAAASTNNGIGIAGVAPGATILPVRVLDRNGDGNSAAVAAGIRYAADKGADVINLSLTFDAGSGVSQLFGRPEAIYSAIDDAWSKGAVVIAAAGNDSVPLCAEPARNEHALCVAATDSNDLPSFYSNSDTSGEFLTAPGGSGLSCDGDVISTHLIGATRSVCSPGSGYEVESGTSLAVPHVAGVAALLASAGLTNSEVVTCLIETAEDLGLAGRDSSYGYGRLDAAAAMTCITT